MRELVEEIDSHAEVIELDGAMNPTHVEDQVPPTALSNLDLQISLGVSSQPYRPCPGPKRLKLPKTYARLLLSIIFIIIIFFYMVYIPLIFGG